MSAPHQLFNRSHLKAQRHKTAGQFNHYNFLLCEAAQALADRLDDITRRFPLALDIGCHTGEIARAVTGHGGIEHLIQTDLSETMLHYTDGTKLACDEEALPFAANSFDLVMSAMNLHWVNDLPGCLVQIQQILKPDGLFMAVIPGGNSLVELRDVLAAAELELTGGMRPRISPFIDVRDAGALLQRAGFSLPVVDSDRLTISYEHMFALLRDLQGMGETNLLFERPKHCAPRRLFTRAAELYQERYSNEEGRIAATVELVTLTAWKPHASQQQPLKRGSGKHSLADYLNS